MKLKPTTDGGETPPALKITEVENCNTMKQRYIIDALTKPSTVDTYGVLDISEIMKRVSNDKGEDYTRENYVYYVRGKFTKVVPRNGDVEWEPPFTLVQIKSNADVSGDNRRRILEALKLAEIDEKGDIDISKVNQKVTKESTSDSSQNSNIWQAIGEFAIVVPENRADNYRAESISHPNDNKNGGNSDYIRQDPTESGSESDNGVGDDQNSITEDAAEASIHLPSYREGYSDGYSDAMRNNQSD